MQIQIRTPAGVLLTLDVKPWDPVSAFRSRLAQLVGITAERQQLSFGGRSMENGRVLLEYGIRPSREGHIIIELLEVDSHWMLPAVEEDATCYLGDFVLRSPRKSSSPRSGSSQFNVKGCLLPSESSTCAPSDCGSDVSDAESLGASLVTSASDSAPLMLLQSQLSSPRGSCASRVPSVAFSKEQHVRDVFVEANAARVKYLLMRRQRLEAEGYGVRELCR